MSDPFDFGRRANRFAVMGNPVAHSQSPRIHRLFARQFDLALDYRRIQVDLGGFAQAVSHFAARDGAGLNITLPFKVEAWRLCAGDGDGGGGDGDGGGGDGEGDGDGGGVTARAARAQAVNTIRFSGDAMLGDNTDGVGLVRDLEDNLACRIRGARILLIGAGGAARGVAPALLDARPARLTIANRTLSRAQELAAMLRGDGDGDGDAIPITAGGLSDFDGGIHPRHPRSPRLTERGGDESGGGEFEIIINATSAGLGDAGDAPAIDSSVIGPGCVAYDLLYAASPTPFMNWAQGHGAAAVSDGLGMLVEQAAESFHLWHGMRPRTGDVIDALRNDFAGDGGDTGEAAA